MRGGGGLRGVQKRSAVLWLFCPEGLPKFCHLMSNLWKMIIPSSSCRHLPKDDVRWIPFIIFPQENDHWREAWIRKSEDCRVSQRAPVFSFRSSSKNIRQTYLSNWSPFRGEIPRSDGLIWEKNWLRSTPGTRFVHFLQITQNPVCFLSAQLLSVFSICQIILSFKRFN